MQKALTFGQLEKGDEFTHNNKRYVKSSETGAKKLRSKNIARMESGYSVIKEIKIKL